MHFHHALSELSGAEPGHGGVLAIGGLGRRKAGSGADSLSRKKIIYAPHLLVILLVVDLVDKALFSALYKT